MRRMVASPMSGASRVLFGVIGAGDTPCVAAHNLGYRFIIDDLGGPPLMWGRDFIAVQRDESLVEAMWGWAGILSALAERDGFDLDPEDRILCIGFLLDRMPAKISSGFLAKTAG